MIERKFVSQNLKEYEIKEYLVKNLNRAGVSEVRLIRTPLGEKILIAASRPGLVVGRSGANIARLTREIKEKFKLENPQIELEEVTNPSGDPHIVAEQIAGALERFGAARFKGIGHKAMTEVMMSGALGVEILISGKIPSSRAKTWRFYQGYLKKCGDIAVNQVKKAEVQAFLKIGVIGIKVRIMPKDLILPDKVNIKILEEKGVEDVTGKETPVAAAPAQEKKPRKKASPKGGPAKARKKAAAAEPADSAEPSAPEPAEPAMPAPTPEGDAQ
jgi:small subunit ribosomal protein S3